MLTQRSNSEITIFLDPQRALDNHSRVFETPKGLSPICDHDHAIHLIPGSVLPNISPYIHPYTHKSEIEFMVAEMLEVGIIQPSQTYFSSPIILVHKKDGSWCMCPYYKDINKLTIKDKFPIPVIVNSWMNYMEQFTSQSWIFIQDIIKLE